MRLSDLNPHGFTTTPEIDQNLQQLLTRANMLENAYGRILIVTSGLRDQALQNQLISAGKSTASKSKHLYGQAVDIGDPNRDLMHFILENLDLTQKIGLWFEDFRYCNSKTGISWVHMQSVSPSSGHRIFIPSILPATDPNCWDGNYDKKYDGV